MNRAIDTPTLDLPTPEALGELEEHIQRRLNSRVRGPSQPGRAQVDGWLPRRYLTVWRRHRSFRP